MFFPGSEEILFFHIFFFQILQKKSHEEKCIVYPPCRSIPPKKNQKIQKTFFEKKILEVQKKNDEKHIFTIIWDIWGTSLALFVDFLNLVEYFFWDLTNGEKYYVYYLYRSIPPKYKKINSTKFKKSFGEQNHYRNWILRQKSGLDCFFPDLRKYFIIIIISSKFFRKNPMKKNAFYIPPVGQFHQKIIKKFKKKNLKKKSSKSKKKWWKTHFYDHLRHLGHFACFVCRFFEFSRMIFLGFDLLREILYIFSLWVNSTKKNPKKIFKKRKKSSKSKKKRWKTRFYDHLRRLGHFACFVCRFFEFSRVTFLGFDQWGEILRIPPLWVNSTKLQKCTLVNPKIDSWAKSLPILNSTSKIRLSFFLQIWGTTFCCIFFFTLSKKKSQFAKKNKNQHKKRFFFFKKIWKKNPGSSEEK